MAAHTLQKCIESPTEIIAIDSTGCQATPVLPIVYAGQHFMQLTRHQVVASVGNYSKSSAAQTSVVLLKSS